jgi:hypothetical protein
MKNPTQNPPPEIDDANELETPPVQTADSSNARMIKEVNLPRPETNPRLKVQS